MAFKELICNKGINITKHEDMARFSKEHGWKHTTICAFFFLDLHKHYVLLYYDLQY